MTSAAQPPSQPPARWVPFAEAQKILGMSEGSLRRAIRDGSVTAEQRRRNPDSATDQRMVYEVLVSEPPTPATADVAPESPSATEPATEPPVLTADLLRAAIDPYVEMNRRIAELYQNAVAENAALERENGKLEAALQAAEQRLTEAREQAARSWWRKWWGG